MLAIIITWAIVAFVFLSIGNFCISVYRQVTKQDTPYSLIDTFMIGMVFTTTLIAISSLFIPANYILLLGLVAICILYCLLSRKYLQTGINFYTKKIKELPKLHLFLILSPIFVFAVHCLTSPMWVDTPYYHIQNIMWDEQYSVVPGLANLQARFGFNSNYFLACSTFGLKPLFGQYIFGVHSLCLVFIFMWVIYKTIKCNSVFQSVVPIVMICSFITVYKLHISSPTTDLLPNLLIMYLFIKVLFDKNTVKDNQLVFIAIPAFCITLKLSAFIICLFAAYVLWINFKNKNYKSLSFFISTGLIIVLPWFIRTVIMTGYLVFPYPGIDIFSFDWKVPIEYVIDQKDYIYAFARMDSAPIDQVLSMPLNQWITKWWQSGMFYYNPYANRFFFIASIMVIISMPIIYFSLRKRREDLRYLYLTWLVALCGFIFWFSSAPDFRFAYGFIISLVFIPIHLILNTIKNEKIIRSNLNIRILISICIVLFLTLQAIRWTCYQIDTTQPIYSLLYKPQNIDFTKKLKEDFHRTKIEFVPVEINNMIIYTSTVETHCYDCPLPCGSDYTGGIEMRGKTLQEGFRTKEGAPYRITY